MGGRTVIVLAGGKRTQEPIGTAALDTDSNRVHHGIGDMEFLLQFRLHQSFDMHLKALPPSPEFPFPLWIIPVYYYPHLYVCLLHSEPACYSYFHLQIYIFHYSYILLLFALSISFPFSIPTQEELIKIK